MFEKIRKALQAAGVECWRINEVRSETAELYFIKKQLDMPRIKELSRWTVTVFRDFEENGVKYRGSSNALISAGMDDAEIESRIRDAAYAASFVKNLFYELPDPEVSEFVPADSDLNDVSPADAVLRLAEAAFEADTEEDAFLNSMEIFVSRSRCRIETSGGTSVSFGSCRASGELVAQCVTPSDVEQFRQFSFDDLNTEALKAKIRETVSDVRARARSSRPPKAGSYDVILKGENLATLFDYYTERSAAAMIYPGYSQWKAGTAVQSELCEGEKLNVSLEPDQPFSAEGIRMKRRVLIRDGVLETVHGPARFCRYLGTEPTGFYSKISCANGTVPLAELEKREVLEPVSFSDFQMDSFDGHFKGEIRLALLHHADGSVEELTGGSVNGSLPDVRDRLIFSLERYSDSRYDGPLAVLIPDVSIAGA